MASTATNHWKLGLFVLLAILAAISVTFWLGARRFERDSFKAISYFDESVQGLEVGSPVKWRGVTVGTVAEITVAPDGRQVQVTSDIYTDSLHRLGLDQPIEGRAFIDPNLRVQLASAGITGVRFLQTDFFDPERYPPPALSFEPPWNYVPSTRSTLKSVEDAALDILNKFPDLEDDARAALADLRRTLASVDRASAWLQADDGSVNRLLVELRETSVKLRRTLDEAALGKTAASLRQSADEVKTAATQVSSAAGSFGELRYEVDDSLAALRETLDSVRALAERLERDPSTLLRGPSADGPVPPEGR
ncbi:MlaD family protein [Candidatus Binatia bacterium]|jgi:paraquat-inducible protein B|nr:MlaD family protein [Candidatus Binatia bacterium]